MWLLRCEDPDEFRKQFGAALAQAIINHELKRQAKWTETLAVGDSAYIEAIEERVQGRQQLRIQQQSRTWTLQEQYGSLFGAEKSSILHSAAQKRIFPGIN